MGNNQFKESSTPFAMSVYLNMLGYEAQTTNLQAIHDKRTGNVNKKPCHSWSKYLRQNPNDNALIIMMGNVFVIDIDDVVENIDAKLNIPKDCWVERTGNGGVHIYFKADPDIAKFNTSIKMKLLGFNSVDILIKNGFAYAGGTSYYHPIKKRNLSYSWDPDRNPLTTPKLGVIPLHWKEEIMKELRYKNNSFIIEVKHYLLGCTGVAGCAGCTGMVVKTKKELKNTLRLLCKRIGSIKGGVELIKIWYAKQDDIDLILDHYYTTGETYPYSELSLRSIFKNSSHKKE